MALNSNNQNKDLNQKEIYFGKYRKYLKRLFKNPLSQKEVEKRQYKVWESIENTIEKKRKTSKLIYLGIAASISLLLGLFFWVLNPLPSQNSMETLANQFSINEQRDTQLILSEDETIYLEEDESQIMYNSKGEISINSKEKTKRDVFALNSLIVPYGKRSKITLEEGTVVWVNSGSKLIYPVTFSESHREVYLEGEAYFEVSDDTTRPFIVQTKDMDVRVLGTGFNVAAYGSDNYISTVLVHGSIELNLNKNSLFNKKTQVIQPNERAVFNLTNNSLTVKEVNTEYYVSWKEGYMMFNNSKLQTIIKKMEKYYDVNISIKDSAILNTTFTGKIDLKRDIEEVINIICATTSLNYIKKDRNFMLDKR